MSDSLKEELENIFRRILGLAELTEKEMGDCLDAIRLALLEAGVAPDAVEQFVRGVQAAAVDQKVIESVRSCALFVEVIRDELAKVMGSIGLRGAGEIDNVVSLAERRQRAADRQQAKAGWDLEDFLEQIQQVKKMGPQGIDFDEDELKCAEAIVRAMTPDERRNPKIVTGSRRRRIARGSGTSVTDLNRLLRDFDRMWDITRE